MASVQRTKKRGLRIRASVLRPSGAGTCDSDGGQRATRVVSIGVDPNCQTPPFAVPDGTR